MTTHSIGRPEVASSQRPSQSIESDRAVWNEALARLDGHLLQTWEWGDFKQEQGWQPERIVIGEGEPRALAQVLYRHKGPVSIGYIPRGPAVAPDDLEAAKLLLKEIDRRSRSHRALSLVIECDRPTAGFTDGAIGGIGIGPERIQPGRTVKVALADDAALLAGMHQKTRYSVRLADRKGVVVDQHTAGDQQALDDFYSMLEETSTRNEFAIHTRAYYESFLQHFADRSVLLIARVEDHPAAGLIVATFGRDAIYMYGASDTRFRALGAAFNLQYRAMQWGREQSASEYDLWGIPEVDPPKDNEHQDHVPATKGDDWRGLYRFKTGFGGAIVSYPAVVQRTYHAKMSRIAERITGR